MRLIIALLIFFSLSFNPLTAFAWGPVTRFDRLSFEEGLSQAVVNSIAQDGQGFIWFGTDDGLNRYDGYSFKIFRHDPKDPTSLSNNLVETLFTDSKGRLWVATSGGLNRYNSATERFVRFKHDEATPHSLSNDSVMSILEDNQGVLWVGTLGGLNRFDETSGQFTHYHPIDDNINSLSDNSILAMYEDSAGMMWLGTYEGLNRYDPKTQDFKHYRHQPSNPHSLNHNTVYAIHGDSKDQLWLGTRNGLNLFDQQKQQFTSFTQNDLAIGNLSNNHVNAIYEDRKGTLWVGTDDGLNRYDAQQQRFTHFKNQAIDSHSLSNNIISAIHEDAQGGLWFGTKGGGLNKLNTQRQFFGHFKQLQSDPYGLSHNSVTAFAQDTQGSLWIGTHEGLNQYAVDSEGNLPFFVQFKHQPTEPRSLGHNLIGTIFNDSNGTLWVGTGGGGLSRYNRKNQDFDHFRHQPDNPNSLSDDNVFAIYEDANKNLWIGTNGGLNRFDPHTGDFRHFSHDIFEPDSLSSNFVSAIIQDKKGILWVGTDGGGLNRFDPNTEQFTVYQHQPTDPNSLSHDAVPCLYEDSKGTLWVCTYAGLNRFDPQQQNFVRASQGNDFPGGVIYGIIEDPLGQLWLSANKGLYRFNPLDGSYHLFNVNDGLQSNEFNGGAYFKSAAGELFFGGVNGFNRFFAEDIEDDRQAIDVVFTDFLLANQSVTISPKNAPRNGQNTAKKFTLPGAINTLQQLTLGYQQNLISFEFAALHFSNPKMNQYAYRLEGQDKDWVFTDAKNRRATYTNIPSGDYILHVKASNNHNHWDEQGKSLKISINPPPWDTWWAWLIYTFCLVSMMASLIRAQHKKSLAQQQKIRDEHDLNLRLTQLDQLKDEFLANTSHELRTPLNGIIGLAESLIDGATGPLPDLTNKNLAMVVASGKRLSNLVNDILDFSKLKNRHLTLQTSPVDLHSMAEMVLTLSRPLVAEKDIKLMNAVPEDLPAAQADENRLQQILHNLVGNAIKFTDVGEVMVSAIETDEGLEISITDSGIGIEQAQFSNIFDSFEQLESHAERSRSGTGLGLSVSKQLVELHGGTIDVKSILGQGSVFSFSLPYSTEKPLVRNGVNSAEHAVSRLHLLEEESLPSPKVEYDGSQFRILLVDDEPVNRQVLHNHLSMQNYQLVEASGGEEALQTIMEHGPFDLILLDIMMPRISGYEVCQTLRKSYPANDLPVIFLTAKNQVADLVQSFAVGANDYLSKPISKHELLVRVETHLKFLDINRNLESKVAERTAELVQKNQEVEHKNDEIIATQQQLVQAEKMASLGTLTAGVAHEINNPTNFVHVSAQNLEVDLDRFQAFLFELAGSDADKAILDSFRQQFKPLHDHLETIRNGTERIKVIVQDLRAFSQLDSAEQKTVLITDLLQSTVNLVQTQYLEVATFITEFDARPELFCYPAQLNQVFMNLIVNACDAISEKQQLQEKKTPGQIIIGSRLLTEDAEQKVEISIRDNGDGMTEKTKNRLFEPFYTTKGEGKGTGLGLSISYGIMQKHGGEVIVDSQLGVGTTFRLILPHISANLD